MDDFDPTDPVYVGLPELDDSPTSPIAVVLEDHTTRQRCEFEEDTVEEFFV